MGPPLLYQRAGRKSRDKTRDATATFAQSRCFHRRRSAAARIFRQPPPHPCARARSRLRFCRASARQRPGSALHGRWRKSICPADRTRVRSRPLWRYSADTPAPAQRQYRLVLLHSHIFERQFGCEPVTAPLDIGVPSGFEIVHDKVQPAPRGRRHGRFPVFFREAMNSVECLVGFAAIAGNDQNLRQCLHCNPAPASERKKQS